MSLDSWIKLFFLFRIIIKNDPCVLIGSITSTQVLFFYSSLPKNLEKLDLIFRLSSVDGEWRHQSLLRRESL